MKKTEKRRRKKVCQFQRLWQQPSGYHSNGSLVVPNPGTALQSQSINHCAKSWHSSTVTINHCAKSWRSSTVTVNQPLCQILVQLYSHSQSTIMPNPGTALQSQSINHYAKSWCSSTVTVNQPLCQILVQLYSHSDSQSTVPLQVSLQYQIFLCNFS